MFITWSSRNIVIKIEFSYFRKKSFRENSNKIGTLHAEDGFFHILDLEDATLQLDFRVTILEEMEGTVQSASWK